MNKVIANLILKLTGLLIVLLSTYITKNPCCLWAIILVMYLDINYE